MSTVTFHLFRPKIWPLSINLSTPHKQSFGKSCWLPLLLSLLLLLPMSRQQRFSALLPSLPPLSSFSPQQPPWSFQNRNQLRLFGSDSIQWLSVLPKGISNSFQASDDLPAFWISCLTFYSSSFLCFARPSLLTMLLYNQKHCYLQACWSVLSPDIEHSFFVYTNGVFSKFMKNGNFK